MQQQQLERSTSLSLDDFACAICLGSPLVDPVTVPCGHSFDRACLETCRKHDRVSGCPVCRKTMPRAMPGVSVMLRDAVARMFPSELRSRQEGLMYDDLEHGNISEAALSSLTERLRAPQKITDMGSLLSMISLMVSVVTDAQGGANSSQVGAMQLVREFDKEVWNLLQTWVVQHDSFQTILVSLTGAIETLVEYLTTSARWSSKELGCLTNDAVERCGSFWSLLSESTGESTWKANRMFFAVSLLESYCLAAGRGASCQIQLRNDTIVSVAGMLMALLVEARATQESSTVATSSIRRMAIDAIGSLAAAYQVASGRCGNLAIVWTDLREQLLTTIREDSDFSVAGVAAQTCACILDRNLCPGDSLGTWLPALLAASQERLCTSEGTRDAVAARRLLAFLGDLHRALPAHDMNLVASLVGTNKFNWTCGLLKTAGEHSKRIEFVAPDDCVSLALGSLEGWEGILLFLRELEAGYADEGFSQWVQPLSGFLAGLPKDSETTECGLRVLSDVLELTLRVRGRIEEELKIALSQHPAIFSDLLPSASPEQTARLAKLREDLGLLHSQSAPPRLGTSSLLAFGGFADSNTTAPQPIPDRRSSTNSQAASESAPGRHTQAQVTSESSRTAPTGRRIVRVVRR